MTRPDFTGSVTRLLANLEHALDVFATRRDLAGLDDRMLKDLGISRAQAEFEASRAPWHRPWSGHPHRDTPLS